jgi:hypothetical protein
MAYSRAMDNASVSDRDVYLKAKLLIDEHGKDGARSHAAGRVTQLLEQNKMDEAMLWGRIQDAVEKMTAPPQKPKPIL